MERETAQVVEGRPICEGCKNPYDPEVCHCGDAVDSHGTWAGHSPVPMGCTCGYVVKLPAQDD